MRISQKLQEDFYQSGYFFKATRSSFIAIYSNEAKANARADYYKISVDEYHFHMWMLTLLQAIASKDMPFIKFLLEFAEEKKIPMLEIAAHNTWNTCYFPWECKALDFHANQKFMVLTEPLIICALITMDCAIIELICSKFAQHIMQNNLQGDTVLHYLVKIEKLALFSEDLIEKIGAILLDYGACPQQKNNYGNGPLDACMLEPGSRDKQEALVCKRILESWNNKKRKVNSELVFTNNLAQDNAVELHGSEKAILKP